MLKSHLDRPILRLALPSLVASLSVPLIGIVDTALVGHLPDVAAMGAVATASVIFDVVYWGFGFFRMGTTALVAQYFGAKDYDACGRTLVQTSVAAAVAGLLLILLANPLAAIGFDAANTSDAVRAAGIEYLMIRVLAAPFVLVGYVLIGFFRGCVDAMSPLWVTLVINVVNVIADTFFIHGLWGAPRLGIVGAAWASVASQVAGTLIALVILARCYRRYVRWEGLRRVEGGLRRLAATHFHLFGRTACLLFAQFALLRMAAGFGEAPLAAHAVLWQIWSLVSYGVDGFAHSAETLVGNALGREDFDGARRFARRCLGWGAVLGVCCGATFWLTLPFLAGMFTDHVEVVTVASALTFWLSAPQPLNGVVFVLDGVLIGANDVRYLFAAMAVVVFAVFVPALWVLSGYNLEGAWMAYNVLMGARFMFLLLRYLGPRWQRSIVADPI